MRPWGVMDTTTVPDEPRQLLRRVRGSSFVTDVDGLVLAWSPEAALHLGVREDQVLGRPWVDLVRQPDGDGRLEGASGVLEAVRAGGVPAPRQLQLRRGDGAQRAFMVACAVFATETPGRPWVLVSLHPASSGAAAAGAPSSSPPRAASLRPAAQRPMNLSRREREVLSLLARGARGEHIAQELGIARATVRNHVQRLFRKLEVRSRLEAVARAYQDGLV